MKYVIVFFFLVGVCWGDEDIVELKSSIDNLTTTIQSTEVYFNNYTQSFLDLVKYLNKIIDVIPSVISISHKLEYILAKDKIAIAALIFFSIGSSMWLMMLIVYNEYRLIRKRCVRSHTVGPMEDPFTIS